MGAVPCSMNHMELGQWGEEYAALHLLKEGYTIRERNWFFGKNEIDIICQKEKNILVIVEVKTRNSDYFGDPQEFVTPSKRNTIIKVADAYIQEHNLDVEVRFDIIGVLHNKTQKQLQHFENAFYFFE
ncbi:MAG: putative endonuclease [Flavobacteriales bacterium]|jgi:putative endonuclease